MLSFKYILFSVLPDEGLGKTSQKVMRIVSSHRLEKQSKGNLGSSVTTKDKSLL